MSNMFLEEKYILNYIKDALNCCKGSKTIINDARYHHNSNYSDSPLIVKNGILSLKELNNRGIKNYSKKILEIMNDTDSHVNGNDGISLSVVGLNDLYPEEEEYNPFNPNMVDFLISSKISAFRTTLNYGNEFLAFKPINNKYLKSIDIRLLKLVEDRLNNHSDNSIINIIDKYNYLKDIVIAINECNLCIPIREMSDDEGQKIDINKLDNYPKILIK